LGAWTGASFIPDFGPGFHIRLLRSCDFFVLK
jgi:hypothetical protein